MTKEIINVMHRMWYIYLSTDGLCLLHADPDIELNNYIPSYASRYKYVNIDKLGTSNIFPDKKKVSLESAVGASASGILFPDGRDYFKILNEWNYMHCIKRSYPVIFFERNMIDKTPLLCLVSYGCPDYIFLEKKLSSTGILYRNKETLTMCLSVPGVIKGNQVYKYWDSWAKDINIFGYSRHYFAEMYYSFDTRKIEAMSLKHMRTEESEKDENVPYIVIHTLGISTDDIRKIQSLGFMWNRPMQVWICKLSDLDVKGLEDHIRQDNLLTPDNMGFVPEWYSSRELDRMIHERRHILNGYSTKIEFDNSDLWNLLLS